MTSSLTKILLLPALHTAREPVHSVHTYAAAVPDLGGPPLFSFYAPAYIWLSARCLHLIALCVTTLALVSCHNTTMSSHPTLHTIPRTNTPPPQERMVSRDELKPSVTACKGTHTCLVYSPIARYFRDFVTSLRTLSHYLLHLAHSTPHNLADSRMQPGPRRRVVILLAEYKYLCAGDSLLSKTYIINLCNK